MVARFFVDENDLALGKALAALHVATIVDALRRIDSGDTVIDPMIVSRVISRRHRGGGLNDLSPREAEVLGLLAEGLSNQAILSGW